MFCDALLVHLELVVFLREHLLLAQNPMAPRDPHIDQHMRAADVDLDMVQKVQVARDGMRCLIVLVRKNPAVSSLAAHAEYLDLGLR